MLTWKPIDAKYAKDGFTESAFAIAFREGSQEIAKLLSDERGYYVDKKEAEVNGWKYRVKMVKSQKGDFTFIERGQTLGDERPEVTAHKAVQNGDYEKRQQDIAQAHRDNQKMHDEKMASDKALTAAINQQTNAVLALAGEIHSLKEIVEIFVRAQPNMAQFTPASKVTTT